MLPRLAHQLIPLTIRSNVGNSASEPNKTDRTFAALTKN